MSTHEAKFITDLIGKTFGMLTVDSYYGSVNKKGAWNCVCKCGNKLIVRRNDLIRKHTQSCGCMKVSALWNVKHGESSSGRNFTKEYRTWCEMRRRCYDVQGHAYKYYGARGIKVCDRWINSYENFLSDMGRAPTKRHSIDRKENDGPYSPENCRWATPTEQANNKRSSKLITHLGKTQSLADWCRELKIPYQRTMMRLWTGWSIEKSFYKNDRSRS